MREIDVYIYNKNIFAQWLRTYNAKWEKKKNNATDNYVILIWIFT